MNKPLHPTDICYIIAGSPALKKEDVMIDTAAPHCIIAADKGYQFLQQMGIKPDIVVGDFDSAGEIPQHEHIIRHPVEKDDTDTFLAVKEALKLGYRRMVIYGGLGGRLDHTLANIQLLCFLADAGGRGFLAGDGIAITAIKNDTISFSPAHQGILSIFCMGEEAKGVNLRGLKYPLYDATVTHSFAIGVSNEFTGVHSTVSVAEGTLAVIWSETAQALIKELSQNDI